MKLPKENQLSFEQKEICFAPRHGITVVCGPPGSGKTVVAFHRARAIEKDGNDVSVVMYNRVLQKFTQSASKELGLATDGDSSVGLYRWANQWWKKTGLGGQFPRAQSGNGWRPPDFDRASRIVISEGAAKVRERGNWGHVIVDEAQDFEPAAHRFLFTVASLAFAGVDTAKRPALTVLADENQRLSDSNSTITQICDALHVADHDLYELHENYRNTREIAAFAARFYTGLPTGMPQPPRARGDLPTIVVGSGLNEAVTRIARYAEAHDDEEIGVLVPYNNTRQKIFNRLSSRLRASSIRVQTYTSDRNDPNNDTKGLEFDRPGRISVLCFASSKGLEFDTVFLPELHRMRIDDGNLEEAKMNLYVMCSRARTRLFLMLEGNPGEGKIWALLPPEGEDVATIERPGR